jgi:hypothetical protein
MPLVIPPFTQFQAPLFPLRGLWNVKPAEGDRFVAAEIDWGTYPPGQGVQFQLSGNSPVALSQIVALSVDNARCGSDIQFVFADSGFILQVPAHAAGVYPVFTNGLMFYAIATHAGGSDVTNLNVHNSMPPPVPVQLSSQQQHASSAAIPLVNGNTQVIPVAISGTLTGIQVIADQVAGATAESFNVTLIDGSGAVLWFNNFRVPANADGSVPIVIAPIALRFFNGVIANIAFSTVTGGFLSVNLYYTTP